MNDLITITQSTQLSTQAVNARDLHAALQTSTRFNDWITRRITQYGFVEGEDFTLLKNEYPQNTSVAGSADDVGMKFGEGADGRIEYHLTLDMAKELAMVENNEIGRQVRKYFIKIEKEAAQHQLEVYNRAVLLAQAEVADLYAKGKEPGRLTKAVLTTHNEAIRYTRKAFHNTVKKVKAEIRELRRTNPGHGVEASLRHIETLLDTDWRADYDSHLAKLESVKEAVKIHKTPAISAYYAQLYEN